MDADDRSGAMPGSVRPFREQQDAEVVWPTEAERS